MIRAAAGLVLVAVVAGACAGPEQRVEGVVVAVDGGLSGISSFTIVTPAGERLQFVPDEGVSTFDHGGSLSHLHEHLQTAAPVRVTYRERSGSLVALVVGDASS